MLINSTLLKCAYNMPSYLVGSPWRRVSQSTPVFLPGESHGQRSLAGYGPQGHKVSDTTEATKYASILGPRDRDEKLSPCSHGADAFIEIDNLGVAIIHS